MSVPEGSVESRSADAVMDGKAERYEKW